MRKNRHNELKYERKRRKINRHLVDSLKSKPCTDCKGVFPPECMDFDHIRDKLFEVSRLKHQSADRLLAEIAKCELVCANCHRIRTKKRGYNTSNDVPINNSSQIMFNFYGA